MYRIAGWVVVKESGLGVPRLLVVINDLDPRTVPEEAELGGAAGSSYAARLGGGDRLGSVLTGPDGAFELTYENTEFQVRNDERRPDLLVSVLAPEEPGQEPEARVLYTSSEIRQNAGLTEQYLIRISADQLLAAGITPPSTVAQAAEPATSVVTRIEENEARRGEIADATMSIARQRVDARRDRFAGFDGQVKPTLVEELSATSTSMLDPDRFVARGESALLKTTDVQRKVIRETVNSDDPRQRPPTRSRLQLTDADVEELRAQAGPDGSVPQEAVAAVARRNGQSSTTTFVQADDRRTLCQPQGAHGECALELLEPSPGPILGPNVVPDDPPTELDETDIPRLLARLMEPLTAPEEDLLLGLMPVATRSSVNSSVGTLAFPPSPADVPAFHDFTSLQLAFDTVWQEVLDQGLIDLVQDIYETVVELGGDPTRDEYAGLGAVRAVVSEGRTTLRAAREVRDHRNGEGEGGVVVTNTNGGGGRPAGSVATGGCGCSGADQPVVRDHRAGAAEIVVRDHRTTSSGDPVERLPDLLQRLEQRLLGKYAFTVFAANAKEHSVNFGLLNTFRQVWTPLGYQAGPLVKSIPLAPRQTQKVVVSRKTIHKRSQKEIETNLRVLKDEMSSTTRTEQEIARRAQSKNDFSVENVDKAGAEPASHTTTVKLGHEATKSSDDIKKSLHEAVFKASQEIKRERVVEINTEETEEFETTETTEITNPNDEIAVTFLFYELERRYRIRERLYRVTPVVFVAQEFPQPHEINAAWLVAHDWILRRVILDDSFLPTLNALTQSAGDESALAEMRVNVQQQRCIVDQLREEVAIARQRATLQQALLERSVFQKAGVLGKQGGGGGGGGIFGIVGDVLSSVTSAASGLAESVGEMVFGGDAGQNQSNRQAMQDRAQEAADQARELMFRLEREVTALNALTESYTKALRDHHTLLTEIARLEGHVMDNIMYYMQKIWSHEPADQRYFRLHNVPVPVFEATARTFSVDLDHPLPSMTEAHEGLPRFGGVKASMFASETLTKVNEELAFAPLAEVADLDNLLGYKGNYMIFPLNESNAITDVMMDPYVDRATGKLLDPSDPANWSVDEFLDYVCCLKDQLTAEELESLLPELREQYKVILSAADRTDDVLVVPTNSLFIEALPAAHELLGNFKRAHRLIDVKAAQADDRAKELENVRRAALLLAGEREDPNIDKRILIENGNGVVVPSDQ